MPCKSISLRDKPSQTAYSNSGKREKASEARSRSGRRGGRGRRRATAHGDAVVSLGTGSRGYLDMTSPPRRLEVRSRLVERFHVCELLHIRFSPSDGLILFVSISALDGPEAPLSCLRVCKLTLIQEKQSLDRQHIQFVEALKVKRREKRRYLSRAPEANGRRISNSCA